MVVERDTWPGDFLLDPVSLIAIAVLILNDWYVKQHWPGFISGKLSDLAGLIFFPLLLVALAELAVMVLRRPWRATRTTFVIMSLVVAAAFAATKAIEPVRDLDEVVLGWLRWLPIAAYRAAVNAPTGSPVRHEVVADLTDLLAVPCVLAAIWIGSRYRPANQPKQTEDGRQVEA